METNLFELSINYMKQSEATQDDVSQELIGFIEQQAIGHITFDESTAAEGEKRPELPKEALAFLLNLIKTASEARAQDQKIATNRQQSNAGNESSELDLNAARSEITQRLSRWRERG